MNTLDGWKNKQAIEEGWILRTDHRIERVLNETMRSTSNFFYSHKEANEFVKARAAEGSAYHIEALARTQLL